MSKTDPILDIKEEETYLSETDKLLLKLNSIISSIKGKEGGIDYRSVKDSFDKLRFKINENLKEVETLLFERDKILSSSNPKDIFNKKKLETKIENSLSDIDKGLKDLDIELKAQKRKKGKYGDISQKEEIKKLMDEKFNFLRNKYNGMEIDDQKIEDNRNNMEKLEELLKNREENKEEEREMYEEEKEQIDEWNKRVAEQDKDLEDVGKAVKQLKNEVHLANENISKTHQKVKKLTKHTDKTTQKIVSQNKKLKDLLNKIRSTDKFCVDVALFLILIGLVGVLYKIIKSKI